MYFYHSDCMMRAPSYVRPCLCLSCVCACVHQYQISIDRQFCSKQILNFPIEQFCVGTGTQYVPTTIPARGVLVCASPACRRLPARPFRVPALHIPLTAPGPLPFNPPSSAP
jgi:hypothetical protein